MSLNISTKLLHTTSITNFLSTNKVYKVQPPSSTIITILVSFSLICMMIILGYFLCIVKNVFDKIDEIEYEDMYNEIDNNLINQDEERIDINNRIIQQ